MALFILTEITSAQRMGLWGSYVGCGKAAVVYGARLVFYDGDQYRGLASRTNRLNTVVSPKPYF